MPSKKTILYNVHFGPAPGQLGTGARLVSREFTETEKQFRDPRYGKGSGHPAWSGTVFEKDNFRKIFRSTDEAIAYHSTTIAEQISHLEKRLAEMRKEQAMLSTLINAYFNLKTATVSVEND